MAGSFNPETNGLDMNNLIEALQTIMDAAQGLRNFNNEVSDSTRQVTSNKKAAQDMFRGLAKNATDAGRELDRTAKELKRINDALPYIVKNTMSTIEKNFAFTSQELNRNFKLDKWMNPVFNEYRILQKKSVKEFEDQLEDIETALASVTDEVERASLKYQKDLIEERKEHVKNKNEWKLMASDNAEYWKTQVVKASKKVLGDLYNFAKSKINSAVSSYASTMQSTYTTIQSYNNYTEKQYNQMFKRLQKSIDDAGLNNIININELQQQYTGAIQGGLTGKNAETNAYYAQIAKQAGVTFDWNDSNWLKTYSRMSKQGNDMEKLSQDIIVATENMMEAAGNGFAFTNGQINSMVDSLNQLQGSLNLTDEAYVAAYKSFGTAGSMLNEWGIDATKIYADITEYATKGITSGATAKLLNMGGLTQAEAERKIEAGETDDIVIKYLTELQNRYDKTTGEFVNVASSALNESLSTEEIQAYQEYVKYLSDNNLTVEEEFARIYDYDKWAYDKMIESLENSETGQDKMQNTLDNIFDEIGKFTAMHPILTQIAQSVMTVAEMAVIGYFMGGTDSTGGRTIQTLLNKIFRRGGTGGAAGPQMYNGQPLMNMGGASGGTGSSVVGGAAKTGFAKLFTNGAQGLGAGKAGSLASKITSSKIGSTVFSTGGKALGVAGSLISMGIDGYQGYQENGWEGAVKGAITGSGKDAETGWDVAKGAGSGALKGAGIGMMFGPWGAAIGAAIGGLTGLAVGLNDVLDTEKTLNRQYANMIEAASDYTKSLSDFESKLSDLSSIQDDASAAAGGNVEATKKLIDKYPQLIKYVDESGTLQGDYADTLDELLQIEQKKLYRENLYTSGGVYYDNSSLHAGNLSKNTKNTLAKLDGAAAVSNIDSNFSKGSTKAESMKTNEGYFLDAMTRQVYTQDSEGNIKDEFNLADPKEAKQWYIDKFTKMGYDSSTIDMIMNDGGLWVAEGLAIKSGLFGDPSKFTENDPNAKSKVEEYDNWYKKYSKVYSDIKSTISSLSSSAFTPEQITNWSTSFLSWSDLVSEWPSDAKYTPKETLDRGFQVFKSLNDYGKAAETDDTVKAALFSSLGITDFSEFKDRYTGDASPKGLYNKFNDAAGFSYKPPFAVGTTGDSTIPYDNYLAYLHKGEQVRTAAEVAVERAEQHVASSNAIGQLNSAVMQQTNTIINLLTQILSVTTSLAGRVGSKPAQSYDYRPVSI